jgi:ribonuclease HII
MTKPLIRVTRPVPGWDPLADLMASGHTIIGIDEVGRGAWAGPVVAGAVELPPGLAVAGLSDSKLITPAARARLDRTIRRLAVRIGIGWVSPVEIDQFGLAWAVRESGQRALLACAPAPGYHVMLDGSHNYLAGLHPSSVAVKADAHIAPVSAASVIAKVARDRYMTRLSRRYKGYGYELHKGYGTSLHQARLASLGPSAVHRLSFKPVSNSSQSL